MKKLKVLIVALLAMVVASCTQPNVQDEATDVSNTLNNELVVTAINIDTLTKSPELIGDVSSINDIVNYPQEAKNKNIEGKVIVKFIVNREGNIENSIVVNKDADSILSNAALLAVSKMKWEPGEINGNPVKVEMYMPFRFQLTNN